MHINGQKFFKNGEKNISTVYLTVKKRSSKKMQGTLAFECARARLYSYTFENRDPFLGFR